MRHAAEEIRKSGEVTRAVGLEMIEGVERLAERRMLAFVSSLKAQPAANRLQAENPSTQDADASAGISRMLTPP